MDSPRKVTLFREFLPLMRRSDIAMQKLAVSILLFAKGPAANAALCSSLNASAKSFNPFKIIFVVSAAMRPFAKWPRKRTSLQSSSKSRPNEYACTAPCRCLRLCFTDGSIRAPPPGSSISSRGLRTNWPAKRLPPTTKADAHRKHGRDAAAGMTRRSCLLFCARAQATPGLPKRKIG